MNDGSACRGAFLITIDTEGDNIWSRPREVQTENARLIPRFQHLCERFGLRPTYLVNYEMAMDDRFQEFAADVIGRGVAEIGMHLHAWNSPPLRPLTPDDDTFQPYLIEYSEPVMREKIAFMTDLLHERLGVRPVSHRAGRWAFDDRYADMLAAHGYRVDCSVTPGATWRFTRGAPGGAGGSDYLDAPRTVHFIDSGLEGRSDGPRLLEVPMTVVPRSDQPPSRISRFLCRRLPRWGRLGGYVCPKADWLRPNGSNLASMLTILDSEQVRAAGYAEFMLHSSELMPGGSPYFRDERSIETLYEHLEVLFAAVAQSFVGMTLGEFAASLVPSVRAAAP